MDRKAVGAATINVSGGKAARRTKFLRIRLTENAPRRQMHHRTTFSAILLALLFAANGVRAQESTLYELTFEATWSAVTHPLGFPNSPHFSGLIGATHNTSVSFWEDGSLASPGIKSMAETGSKSTLKTELVVAYNAGLVRGYVEEGGIGRSPGSITISFRVYDSHPLLTLVSMLAPSPDWFVGVTALPLRDANDWIDQIVVDLYTRDAGTDSGVSYTSANQPTQPPVPVTPLTDPPMLVQSSVPPVGRFIINRMPVLSTDDSPSEHRKLRLGSIYPNPFSNRATIEIELHKAGPVRLDVFDLLGRRVDRLHDGFLGTGSHTIEWRPESETAGMFFVRLTASGESQSRTLVRVAQER